MSRVIVTGAGGFIGQPLVRALAARGHAVLAALHRPEGPAEAGVERIALDVADAQAYAALPRQADVVVHAAARRLRPYAGPEEREALLRTNILGTLHVLTYAQAAGARLVYCSSLSVYALPQPLPISEEGRTYPLNAPESVYATSKLAAELLCARMHVERQVPTLCVRLARIYGPGEPRETLTSQWVASAQQGRELLVHADGMRSLDFLYIEDAVRGLVAAVEAPHVGGVVNLGSGKETTWRELAEAVAEVFSPRGRRCGIRSVAEGDRSRCVLEITRAQRELTFAPQFSLREGLSAWRDALTAAAPVEAGT